MAEIEYSLDIGNEAVSTLGRVSEDSEVLRCPERTCVDSEEKRVCERALNDGLLERAMVVVGRVRTRTGPNQL
jgi:hypothetical protein